MSDRFGVAGGNIIPPRRWGLRDDIQRGSECRGGLFSFRFLLMPERRAECLCRFCVADRVDARLGFDDPVKEFYAYLDRGVADAILRVR